ncbi:GlxA family transcriptional regulator [Aquabacterium sp.]|uniref:GlxA family transcriptional regulator n=1 Tax=Aquabacterium sp. TaxID=1872578 RepID=UPI003D6D433D
MVKPARQVHQIGVVLCRHHSLASVGLVFDTFRMANQLPGTHRFALSRISQDGQPVPHPDGLLAVDGGLADLARMALVVIPSLWAHGDAAVADQPLLIDALRALPPRVLVATMCTGAYLLAASGRLNQRRATTHWMLADGFHARFPEVQLQPAENLTHDGNFICSGGSLAAVDACLYVVQLMAGRDTARELARMLVTDVQRGPQALYAPPQGWRQHGDAEVRKLETYIADHHADSFTLDELAAQIHVSVRTLQRRFLAATGLTPIQYQQAVRIERGKDLLESDHLPVQEIAAQVGYQDRVAFGRLFKKVTGMTPAAYRQRQRRV